MRCGPCGHNSGIEEREFLGDLAIAPIVGYKSS
jgi:hypothetical protein